MGASPVVSFWLLALGVLAACLPIPFIMLLATLSESQSGPRKRAAKFGAVALVTVAQFGVAFALRTVFYDTWIMPLVFWSLPLALSWAVFRWLTSGLGGIEDRRVEQPVDRSFGAVASVIKAIAALLALLPGLAIFSGLVEIPPTIRQLTQILSFSVSLVVLLLALLLSDRIQRMTNLLVLVLSISAVVVGGAFTVAYVEFTRSHTVVVDGVDGREMHIIPLNPSSELLRRVEPWGYGYGPALAQSPERDRLRDMMAVESASSILIMIALLLFAQLLLMTGVVVAAWKLALTGPLGGSVTNTKPKAAAGYKSAAGSSPMKPTFGDSSRIVRALAAIVALLPGIAFIFGLVDVPPDFANLLKILSISIGFVVLVSVVLLRDAIRRMRVRLAAVLLVLCVIAGAATTFGYYRFAASHTVVAAGRDGPQTFIIPLNPSEEVRSLVNPFENDFGKALQMSPQREELKLLMRDGSLSSSIIMIVLLILSQILFLVGMLVATFKLPLGRDSAVQEMAYESSAS